MEMTATVQDGRLAGNKDLRLNADAGGRRDVELLRRYAQTRDPRLREQLVPRYLPPPAPGTHHCAPSSATASPRPRATPGAATRRAASPSRTCSRSPASAS